MSYCSSLYRESYNAADCYEFATVSEMNGVDGALPIPASTAQRFYQSQASTNSMGQVQNPTAPEINALANAAASTATTPDQAAANLMAAAAQVNRIRMNRRF